MVEPAEREPTMEEIVVALRETRRGAVRLLPFAVVGGQPGGNRASGAAAGTQNGPAGSTDVADLRNGEIERLLAENAHLNERVVFLIKVIEREQARNVGLLAGHAAIERVRGAISLDVREALEAELRPVLLIALRLLEKQRADPAGEGARPDGHEAACAPALQAPGDADWIVDLEAQHA